MTATVQRWPARIVDCVSFYLPLKTPVFFNSKFSAAPTIQLRNNDENEESSAYLRYKPWEMDSHFSRLSMDFRFSDSDAKEGILVYGETSQGKIFKIYVVGTKGKVMLDTTNVADFELREDHSM